MSPAPGLRPVLRLTGLDVPLPEGIDDHVTAMLLETVTNAAWPVLG